ncbi:MAG: peptidylprolyl isomerase [Candidatus Altiarchaeota archaeon]|nr:peptidylprolyl isomerase [Candidatus Altiarchaeota archaeon]
MKQITVVTAVLFAVIIGYALVNLGDNMTNKIAVIDTNYGTMEIELFEDRAPITTKNFIDLAEKGFYDNLIFHRVIKEFMIQGGDPDGRGTGGPGYEIPDEFHAELKHDKPGILSMANSGPNTGGSQFFITLIPTPWLDGKHSVFGQIIKGEEILQKIGAVQTGPGDKPLTDIVMKKVIIK